MALLRLEAFEADPGQPAEPVAVPPGTEVEEHRLEAYENGYQNGWDDALNAQASEQMTLRADLARNLQALNFTYQEARAHVVRSVTPLLQQVLDVILPDLAQKTLAHAIMETLAPMLEQAADAPVVVVLNPADRPALDEFLRQGPALPIEIQEEPGLSESQAFLRIGENEMKIDPGRAAKRIAQLVSDFLTSAGERPNG